MMAGGARMNEITNLMSKRLPFCERQRFRDTIPNAPTAVLLGLRAHIWHGSGLLG